MYARNINFPTEKSFFLFGPRGTGKTTWIRNRFPEDIHIDLLASDIFTELLASPQRLENYIPPAYDGWVIIDEIQRLPALLNEIHRLIEARKIKFVLTGSSARKLRQKGVNLLAGRALSRAMHPLTAAELGDDFTLEHSLSFGNLPAVFADERPSDFLKGYVYTYLREEVLQEGLTRNLQAFARFLEAASFSQASVLNITEVARECGVNRKLAEGYFTILEDLLLATRVEVFSKHAARRMVVHPKFFFFDTGVFRAIRPKGPLDRPEEIDGAALETLVFQELSAVIDNNRMQYKLYFWRTSNGQEVDFVLYGDDGLIAVEVKRAGTIRRNDLKGLLAFAGDYPMAKLYLFYGGGRRQYEGGIEMIPLAEALKKLAELLTPATPEKKRGTS